MKARLLQFRCYTVGTRDEHVGAGALACPQVFPECEELSFAHTRISGVLLRL